MERRREPMFWKIIERSTNLVFLLLAIVILSDQWKNDSTASQIAVLKKGFENVASNNLNYLETRLNKVSESSDNYQVAITTRINILEDRVVRLEKENKTLKLQQKNIITQTNTQIVNGERKNN